MPPESALYAVLRSPGRATDTAGDGGMGSQYDRRKRAQNRQDRAREVSQALFFMPRHLKHAVMFVYDVPRNERFKSERSFAEHHQISREETGRILARAYGWLDCALSIEMPLDVLIRSSVPSY